jgi:hypothetical protein
MEDSKGCYGNKVCAIPKTFQRGELRNGWRARKGSLEVL